MSFRTVEITGPAELHVKSGLLIVEKEFKNDIAASVGVTAKSRKKSKPETTKISIPLEDISTIVCMGAGIRLSTMAMAQICQFKISMMMLDEKYRPAGILTAYEANVKQSLMMRKQVYMKDERADSLWRSIVGKKIQNQSDALEILGLPGIEKIRKLIDLTATVTEIDALEARAAKLYFEQLCPDMNRREETPMNSRLNYGYSIIRNSISRAIVSAGLLPSFGLHHRNLYNSYNLADDLIEPFRPCVDMIAYRMVDAKIQLTREERRQLAMVLQMAVSIGGQKMTVLQAIDTAVNDLRKYIIGESDTICMPGMLTIEYLKQIKE